MEIFKIVIATIFFAACSSISSAQDTINWRPDYKLKWEDFQGKPDTTVIALAVCASEVTYQYKIVDGKLTYTINCFFDKKRSWIKYNMTVITEHEQGHFDISKLFSLKLEEKFKNYKISNPASVYGDLQRIYSSILYVRTQMHNKYDTETQSTVSDELQKKFIKKIRDQIRDLEKQMRFNQ
ncbi:MAG: hypothetical protein JNL23_06645 [Chitinophagaceae bacterium]|nr:hypothetical protein [Chitinophagaceae bacterium]